MLIVIDPGHGGNDPGAIDFGLKEKDIVLNLALLLTKKLNKYETETILTRDKDIEVSLASRAGIANNRNANFFLSLHVNAGKGSGFESYIHTGAPQSTEDLRSIIHDEIAHYYKSLGLKDRGKKRANFAVLRLTKMPAVLLENLFIDNPEDAAYLAGQSFINGLAEAISIALKKTLNLKLKQKWDPAKEISRLKERGLIFNEHDPESFVTWGEFATVINRLLESS